MKTRRLYEVLYRFNLGSFVGAHAMQIERITDDETGEVYAEKVLDPEAVTVEQASALIGGETATVLAQCSDLQAQLTAAKARAVAAEAAAEAAVRAVSDLEEANAAKMGEIGRLVTALEAAQERIVALENENEALKAEVAAAKGAQPL